MNAQGGAGHLAVPPDSFFPKVGPPKKQYGAFQELREKVAFSTINEVACAWGPTLVSKGRPSLSANEADELASALPDVGETSLERTSSGGYFVRCTVRSVSKSQLVEYLGLSDGYGVDLDIDPGYTTEDGEDALVLEFSR